MNYYYAFFDVDCLEFSPMGTTFKCHPEAEPIQEKLFDLYGAISEIVNPIIFTTDINSKVPQNFRRKDFVSIPADASNEAWKSGTENRMKYYLERDENINDASKAIFDSNKNALTCIKTIKTQEWVVFGKGLSNSVDHVICSILETGKKVSFIPELIIPSPTETPEMLNDFIIKWQQLGAMPVTYSKIINLSRRKKIKHL